MKLILKTKLTLNANRALKRFTPGVLCYNWQLSIKLWKPLHMLPSIFKGNKLISKHQRKMANFKGEYALNRKKRKAYSNSLEISSKKDIGTWRTYNTTDFFLFKSNYISLSNIKDSRFVFSDSVYYLHSLSSNKNPN